MGSSAAVLTAVLCYMMKTGLNNIPQIFSKIFLVLVIPRLLYLKELECLSAVPVDLFLTGLHLPHEEIRLLSCKTAVKRSLFPVGRSAI